MSSALIYVSVALIALAYIAGAITMVRWSWGVTRSMATALRVVAVAGVCAFYTAPTYVGSGYGLAGFALATSVTVDQQLPSAATTTAFFCFIGTWISFTVLGLIFRHWLGSSRNQER